MLVVVFQGLLRVKSMTNSVQNLIIMHHYKFYFLKPLFMQTPNFAGYYHTPILVVSCPSWEVKVRGFQSWDILELLIHNLEIKYEQQSDPATCQKPVTLTLAVYMTVQSVMRILNLIHFSIWKASPCKHNNIMYVNSELSHHFYQSVILQKNHFTSALVKLLGDTTIL